jgi:hypothetical protein
MSNNRQFIVRPLAEVDLESAARWYDEERPGLADRFRSDVDHANDRHTLSIRKPNVNGPGAPPVVATLTGRVTKTVPVMAPVITIWTVLTAVSAGPQIHRHGVFDFAHAIHSSATASRSRANRDISLFVSIA